MVRKKERGIPEVPDRVVCLPRVAGDHLDVEHFAELFDVAPHKIMVSQRTRREIQVLLISTSAFQRQPVIKVEWVSPWTETDC